MHAEEEDWSRVLDEIETEISKFLVVPTLETVEAQGVNDHSTKI